MTEAEYVQAIRDAAQRYTDVIRDGVANRDGKKHLDRRQAIKDKFSPHTAIQLCDLWLEKNGGDRSQEATVQPRSPDGH
jgi:hypothetical protein